MYIENNWETLKTNITPFTKVSILFALGYGDYVTQVQI